jgi:hypothetical protein
MKCVGDDKAAVQRLRNDTEGHWAWHYNTIAVLCVHKATCSFCYHTASCGKSLLLPVNLMRAQISQAQLYGQSHGLHMLSDR